MRCTGCATINSGSINSWSTRPGMFFATASPNNASTVGVTSRTLALRVGVAPCTNGPPDAIKMPFDLVYARLADVDGLVERFSLLEAEDSVGDQLRGARELAR